MKNVDSRLILIGLLLLLSVFYIVRSIDLTKELAISNQNQVALIDSIRKIKTDRGVSEFQKAALIKSQKELSDSLRSSLKKQNQKIEYYSHIIGQISSKQDSTQNVIMWNNDLVKLPFNFSSNWYNIQGYTQLYIDTIERNISIKDPKTFITQNIRNLELNVGLKRDKAGIISAFISSPDTSLSISKLETTLIKDEFVSTKTKEKRISIGPQIGYGFSQSFNPAVYIGIGVQYSLIRF